MIEKHQMRCSPDGKDKIIVLDKRQDYNNTFTYLIKVMGADPYWTSAVAIQHYWPVVCG